MNQDTKTQKGKHTPRDITDAMFMWSREEGKGIRGIRKKMDHSLGEYGVRDEVDFLLGIPGVFSIAAPWYVNFYVTFLRKVNYFVRKSLLGFCVPPVDHERSV
jgi:hypothetical protein